MERKPATQDTQGTVRKSMVLNGLDFVAQTAAMFLVTPAMAKGLGLESYGSWLLIMSVFAYLQLLEAGVSTAGTKFLASAVGSKDETLFPRRLAALRQALGLSGWIAAGIVMAGLAVTTALAAWGRCPSYVPWLLLIFLPPTFLTFWLRDRLIVLRAFLRYELIVTTTLGRTVVQTVLVLLALHCQASFLWLALAHAVPQTLCYLAQSAFASKLVMGAPTSARPEDSKELRSIANHVFVSQLAISLTGRAEPFLASFAGTVTAVPLHGIARRFTALINEAFQATIGSPLASAFGRGAVPGGEAELLLLLRHCCRLVSMLSGGACALLVLVSGPFIQAWLPPVFAPCSMFIALMAPGLALRLASTPTTAFLLAKGAHRTLSALSVALALLSLGLMAGLGWSYGLTGLFGGLGAAEVLLFGCILPVVLGRHMGTSPLSFYLLDVALPLLAGALPAWLLAWLLPGLLVPDYVSLGCFAVVSGGGTVLAAFLVSKHGRGGCQQSKPA
jgi:O-antigen/teichoic acid export membrane protein